jgi:hypothetical protein
MFDILCRYGIYRCIAFLQVRPNAPMAPYPKRIFLISETAEACLFNLLLPIYHLRIYDLKGPNGSISRISRVSRISRLC